MINYLYPSVKRFTHILHIADIHIRLRQRHEEYAQVFQKLYDEIKNTPEETAVAILGDLFHSKCELTPECLQIAVDFLRNIADLRPTILIPGNHDSNLNNKNRLDSSSPIVNAINHPNLFFLRDGGIYVFGNILFNHYCVFDDYTQYINYFKIPKKALNETEYHIALYHGTVQDAMTDYGFRIASKTINNNTFDGHHIVLLGDIHHHQRLQEYSDNYSQPAIVYAGSLIQQNHGEKINGHGYVLWDLKTKQYTHTEIQNDYGFYTVEIENGKLYTPLENLPKKVFLRAKCNQTIKTEIEKVLKKIKETSDVLEVVYEKIDFKESEKKNIIDVTNLNVNNVGNLDYQNRLISAFFENKSIVLRDDLAKQVYNINKEMNNQISKDVSVRNIRWKPKKFEFENMFSYGSGNVIDFSKMKNIIGLFANNASGKSSILSALCYCIFDKCDRAFKAIHVMNTQKMSFNCKFNFEIDNIDYFIERKGLQDKKGNVKVDVKFYRIVDGNVEDLNGEARRNTNDVIREYLGTYEDFLLTVLSIQNNNQGSFIDMGQADRKDLISKFMGITIFDKLTEASKEKSKEINTLLKSYEKTDYPRLLEERIHDIVILEAEINKENDALNVLTDKLSIQNERLLEESKKLINTGNAPTNIDELNTSNTKLTKEKQDLNDLISKQKPYLSQFESLLEEINESIKQIDINKLKTDYSKYTNLLESGKELKSKINFKKYDIDTKTKRVSKLKEHKYNPNCEACRSNAIVKELTQTIEDIKVLDVEYNSLLKEEETLLDSIKLLEYTVAKNNEYQELEKKKIDTQNKINIGSNAILKNENRIQSINNELQTIESKITAYHKEKEAIEKNKITNQNISSIKSIIKTIEDSIKLSNKKLIDLNGKKTAANEQKNNYEDTIKNAKVLQLEQEAYKYYIMAIDRDGIPYDLISQALPTLEGEINNILQQIVEFTIELKTDGKNVIGYINYDGKKWALEMASGLERFVSSLAIRVALINISNLPRPNFIAIDEGFGCADKENLNSMSSLLSYFKFNFDFVWVVSHLDIMKDMVDTQLEIKKENGFSKIVHI